MKKLLHEYSDKLHELETLGGYSIHHKTEEVLQGLGFANAICNDHIKNSVVDGE